MTLEIKEGSALPPLVRGGQRKNSEENEAIKKLLASGKISYIENIVAETKEANSLQQRIRTLAHAMGIKATIRFDRENNTMWFADKDKLEDAEKAEQVEANASDVKKVSVAEATEAGEKIVSEKKAAKTKN